MSLVCDQELIELDPPSGNAALYLEEASGIKEIVVGVSGNKKVSKSQLFGSAKVTSVDPYTIESL